jgi:hypothetical protein
VIVTFKTPAQAGSQLRSPAPTGLGFATGCRARELKRDLPCASVKGGLATGGVRGIMHGDGLSLFLIRRNLGITTTVVEIVET